MSTKSLAGNGTSNSDLSSRVDQSELLHLLGYNVRRTYLAIQSHFDAQMDKLGLRQADFAVISIVRHNRGINQKALADALAIAPPNLATLLDRLEENGILIRQRSCGDKRVQLVSLTPKGTALHVRALKAAQEADGTASQRLSGDECRQLRHLLADIFMP